MQIQVDTREHDSEWKRIKAQFDALGVDYFRSKLYVGDYMSLDNPRLVIDRKKDLQEVYSNICQQHERFKAELVRAMEQGIKIIILCEHGEDIKTLDDVIFFYQPEMERYTWKTQEIAGSKVKIKEKHIQKPIHGEPMYKALCTIRDRYNVDFVFCQKEETGAKIVEILSNDN